MAAPSIQQILDGVEAVLRGIDGLRVSDYSPGQVTPPQAIITVPPITYRQTFGARRWQLDMTITVLTSAALDRAGQRRLAEFADHTGPRSIFQAFGGAGGGVDLDGLVEVAYITGFAPLGLEQVGQIGYFGGEFTLTVVAPGG